METLPGVEPPPGTGGYLWPRIFAGCEETRRLWYGEITFGLIGLGGHRQAKQTGETFQFSRMMALEQDEVVGHTSVA